MSKPYGVPCSLCPCRKAGWPKRHEIPDSMVMKRVELDDGKVYVRQLSNDIAQEVIRRDAEKPCNDCLNSFDFKNADTIAAVHAAESSINYLLEQDIMGAANIPDYIPATENYQAYIRDARNSWGTDLAEEFEAGTPTWTNESYRPLHEQSFNTSAIPDRYLNEQSFNNSAISERYLSGPPSPSPSLDRSWAPQQRASVGSLNQHRQTVERPRRQSLPGRQRSLTKIEPYNRSPSKQDQSFTRSPMNKPSPLLADNRTVHFNQRVVPSGQHASRPRQAGEPGERLLGSQIHRSPITDPRYRSAPPSTISGRQTPDRFAQAAYLKVQAAHLKVQGIRTMSTYASPASPAKINPLTAVTTGGHYPSLVIPGSTREVWQKLTVPQEPQSNHHFRAPQNDAAEAFSVREAVKRQTTKVCQEIIDRKHSLDLFQQQSPRETYEDQAIIASVTQKKIAVLDELKQQKNQCVAKLEEFSERNIGLSVGESSTTPLEGNKDKGLVEEAKQLLQHMVPPQRPNAMRTTVNHNLEHDMTNTTMNTTGASSVDESFLQAQLEYEEMKKAQMRAKATGKQPQRPNSPVIQIDQSSGMTPPLSPAQSPGVDRSRLSVVGEQSFLSENDQSRLSAAEQRRLESNEQSRIMAESIAHRDASVINGTVSMGFDTSGLNTSLTGDSFNTTGVSLLENSGRSESRSMLQAKEDYMRRVEEMEERNGLELRRQGGNAEQDEQFRTKHRTSLVLNELLNRVDGIKTPTSTPQSTIFETPHSLNSPHNRPSQDGSFYSIPYDISTPQPEDSFSSVREMHTAMRDPSSSFSSVREMHTAMRDPSSSYFQTQHMTPNSPTTPNAHSTTLGSVPDYQNNSLHQRYELSRTPERCQQAQPQSPIVIEISTNPTIINTPGHNISADELGFLNRSVDEVRGSTEQNKRGLGELRELFEGIDLKEMVEVFKKAKSCKCGVLKVEEASVANSSLNTTGASLNTTGASEDISEELDEEVVEEIGKEKPEGYTVI